MEQDFTLATIAENIGMGLVSGVVGTAAMTVSQTIEMQLRDRKPSIAPAEAASQVLGVHDVLDEASKAQQQNLSQLVHWSYGTMWGGVRGLLDSIGLDGASAAVAHFAAIWSTALFVMPSLEGSDPVSEWPAEEVEISAIHHTVYIATVNFIYALLKEQARHSEH